MHNGICVKIQVKSPNSKSMYNFSTNRKTALHVKDVELCSNWSNDDILCRIVGHFAYCATPLSLMSFKLSKTFNYQPLFFHSPTQNENVKKVQSVFLPNWNWLFLLIFSLFKVEKIKIHD